MLLQEVDSGAKRSRGDRQVDVLADALGFAHRTWAPNVEVRGGGEYGNAILSRFPIVETHNIDLTQKFKKRRSSLFARVRVSEMVSAAIATAAPAIGGVATNAAFELDVYNVHLGLAEYERKRQIKQLIPHLSQERPVIVGGDMNDVWNSLAPTLRDVGFLDSPAAATFPAWAPMRALDRFFARGAVIDTAARCDSPLARVASDHRPLMAAFRLT